MRTTIALLFAICLASGGYLAAQEKNAQASSTDHKRLADLVAKGVGPYTKLAEGVWTTSYRGKNIGGNISIRIAAAEGGIFFFVDLFDRKSITLSRNLLLKIAELNSNFDYGKIALTDAALQVRLDVRAKLVDADEFKMLEQQAANMADEAYGIIKDFVQ